MQVLTDESRSRRTIREVVALSALPSIWVGYEPLQVAESLAEVLLNMLPLEFVYLRLRADANGEVPEVVRTGSLPTPAGQAREIGQAPRRRYLVAIRVFNKPFPTPLGAGRCDCFVCRSEQMEARTS